MKKVLRSMFHNRVTHQQGITTVESSSPDGPFIVEIEGPQALGWYAVLRCCRYTHNHQRQVKVKDGD